MRSVLFAAIVLTTITQQNANAGEPQGTPFGVTAEEKEIAALRRQRDLLIKEVIRVRLENKTLRSQVRWIQDPTMLDAYPYTYEHRTKRNTPQLKLPYRQNRGGSMFH